MKIAFDSATHVGGHAWQSIDTHRLSDSERYNSRRSHVINTCHETFNSKTNFLLMILSLPVNSSESGGGKKSSDDHWNIDSNDGNKSDDNEVDQSEANDLMDRIPKNITAVLQVTS